MLLGAGNRPFQSNRRMMATKVSLTGYVDTMLGRTGTSLSDHMIFAGMEDVVHKMTLFMPQNLNDMTTETTVTSTPTTIHNVTPNTVLYCDGVPSVRINSGESVHYRRSLFHDYGITTSYYFIGDKLHIKPFDSSRNYTLRGITYSVSNGVLTWPDKYIYPLAIFCAYSTLFKEVGLEIEAIVTLMGRDISATFDYAGAIRRLSNDDVELAKVELEKIMTQINQYATTVGHDQAITAKATERVKNVENMLIRYNSLKLSYAEYFGLTVAQEKDK